MKRDTRDLQRLLVKCDLEVIALDGCCSVPKELLLLLLLRVKKAAKCVPLLQNFHCCLSSDTRNEHMRKEGVCECVSLGHSQHQSGTYFCSL